MGTIFNSGALLFFERTKPLDYLGLSVLKVLFQRPDLREELF
ncbi:hypothetical protein OCEANICA350_12806 [Oceanicaulis sp. 350]|nr:hypothetical protein OCEANICA350_12806 [Oceanicaulis sp. 350]